MTIDQWIAILTSSAAFASAMATFLTVRQMAKQRQTSYQPELAFSRTIFYAVPTEGTDSALLDKWIPGRPDEKDETYRGFSLQLRNIGLGAARDISLKWSFDIEGFVQSINSLAQKTMTTGYIKLSNTVIENKLEGLGHWASMWGNQQEVDMEFVLPASSDPFPQRVALPWAYINLASVFLILQTKNEGTDRTMDLPPLTVDLTFQDIGGKKHKVHLCIEVVISSYQPQMMRGFVKSSRLAIL